MNEPKKIVYPYKKEYPLADTESAVFEVEIISSATTATTSILTPTATRPVKITDNASLNIGTGKSLRGTTYISSILSCPVAAIENIEVNYKINGHVLVPHSNPTSEQDRPRVDIAIHFVEP